MEHQITIDKENKVLILKVSVPRKKLAREPNVMVRSLDAWELVKNTRVDGFVVEYKKNLMQLDNWRALRHEGEFVFPLRPVAKPKPVAKPTRVRTKTTSKKVPTSKVEDAKAKE